MSSQAQFDANRANAQKSSGPVTDDGKAASSQNHASHRLSHHATFKVLDTESYELYCNLVIAIAEQFKALDGDKAERAIIDRMAQHEWMRRRALNFQDFILSHQGPFRMEQMKLFMRYESQHERAYNACVNQLLKLRSEKRSAKIGFERQTHIQAQADQRKQRHQVDIDCKIVRALRTAANNPEALDLAREVKTRHQTA